MSFLSTPLPCFWQVLQIMSIIHWIHWNIMIYDFRCSISGSQDKGVGGLRRDVVFILMSNIPNKLERFPVHPFSLCNLGLSFRNCIVYSFCIKSSRKSIILAEKLYPSAWERPNKTPDKAQCSAKILMVQKLATNTLVLFSCQWHSIAFNSHVQGISEKTY